MYQINYIHIVGLSRMGYPILDDWHLEYAAQFIEWVCNFGSFYVWAGILG